MTMGVVMKDVWCVVKFSAVDVIVAVTKLEQQ
jgi:hypothetical protein